MRRAPAFALALALPAAGIIGGSAAASSSTPMHPTTSSLASTAGAQSSADSMAGMDMSAPPAGSTAAGGVSAARALRPPHRAKVIKGVVGPGFTISVSPTTVKAGKYKLVVQDKGTIHNFHITGTGVDQATTIAGTGKSVFKVTLVAGAYHVQCDAHSATMNTTLTVT